MHRPLRLAEDFAYLDQLSRGRISWGIGRIPRPAGVPDSGIPDGQARRRLRRSSRSSGRPGRPGASPCTDGTTVPGRATSSSPSSCSRRSQDPPVMRHGCRGPRRRCWAAARRGFSLRARPAAGPRQVSTSSAIYRE
ncbi:LLM class flavin-dependent oxidoreductase [Pseudonocardia sp. MCCB 268]|nr:LLM class flavin-dependent oxidoreductase [Pseudonocardia cytotoxica]